MKKIKTLSIALALAFTLLSCKEKTAQPARKEFLPALDRATKTTIEIAGYLANLKHLIRPSSDLMNFTRTCSLSTVLIQTIPWQNT